VAAPYTSHNACGIMDAFGTWSKADFLSFLDALESKYGIKQAMMYEWQYVPEAWLNEAVVEEVQEPWWSRWLCKLLSWMGAEIK
jgi:hypothetical protein